MLSQELKKQNLQIFIIIIIIIISSLPFYFAGGGGGGAGAIRQISAFLSLIKNEQKTSLTFCL